MDICSQEGCDRLKRNETHCIYHANKDGWREDEIKEFWGALQYDFRSQYLKNFSNFIFPRFSNSTASNIFLNLEMAEKVDKDLSFRNAVFLDEMIFKNIHFQGNVDLTHAIFHNGLKFQDCAISGDLNFQESNNNGGEDLNRLSFTDTKIEGSVEFFLTCKRGLQINLYRTTIKGTLIISGNSIHPNSIEAGMYITLSNVQCQKSGYFEITDFHICDFTANYTVNYGGKIKIHNVIVIVTCELRNSDFDNVEFSDFQLHDFTELTLSSSSFQNTIFNNFRWPSNNNITGSRDIFRQLKSANDKQGNHIQANRFYAMEMKSYFQEIAPNIYKATTALSEKLGFFHKSKALDHLQDKIIFLLSWASSNFSTNWLLPLCWIFIFGLLLFWGANIASTEWKDISFSINDLSIRSYVEFINPLEKAPKSLKTSGYILWMVYRLLVFPLLTYQFIVSLRRQTKR